MEQNVGNVDKVVRVLLAIVFVVLGLTVSYWFFILTVILLFTVFTSFCALYKVVGINTCKAKINVKDLDKAKNTKK
jgi:hypothetical protein